MKSVGCVKALLMLLLVSMALHLWAQQSASEISQDGERQRIKEIRQREEFRFDGENAACYQKFAVTDCLNEVRSRRRQSMEDLQRQDNTLNDIERKQKAFDQIKRIEEKSASEVFAEQAENRAQALKETEARLERVKKKNAERLKSEQEKRDAPSRVRNGIKDSQTEASRAADKKVFDDKQKTAAESKARREKTLAEKEGKNIKPLPAQP